MINHTFQYIISENLSANETKRGQLRTHGDSYFLIQKIFSIHNNEYKVLFNDSHFNKDWANEPINITCFAGTPEFPAKLLKEVILPPACLLKYTLINSNISQNVELVLQGLKIFGQKEMPKLRYRQYATTFILPALAKVPQVIEMDTASTFYVQKILGFKKHPDANLIIDMFDVSSLGGRRIIDTSVNVDNFVGRALRPNIIPELELAGGSVLTIAIRNTENYDTEFQLVLDGYEVSK